MYMYYNKTIEKEQQTDKIQEDTKMMIMKNGTVQMELKEQYKAMGYTMRSNINQDLVPTIKRWNKKSAQIISAAIKRGDCKAVLAEMKNTKGRNAEIRKIAEHHDKIVYDRNGVAVFWWDVKEKAIYELEK